MDFADSFFDKDQFATFNGGNEFEADYPFFDKFPFQSEESSIPQEDVQVQQNKDQPNLSTFTIPEIQIPSQAGTYGLQITSASIESHSAPLQIVSTPLSSSFEKQEQDLCSSTSSLRITPLPELPLTNLSIESSSNRSTTSSLRRNSLDQSNDSTSIPLLCNNQSPLSSPRGEPTSPRGIDSTVTTKEKKSEAKKDKKDKNKDKYKGTEKKEKQNLKLQRGSKNRLKWTPELITLFQNAVKKLGAGAVPSAILEEMNVKGLSRENVASHLQKYRLQNKKVPPKDNTDDILYPEEKEQLKTMASLDLHEKYMDYHRRYTMPPPPQNMMPPHMGHPHPHQAAPTPYYCYSCTRRYSLPGCSLDQTPPPHPPSYHVNKYEM